MAKFTIYYRIPSTRLVQSQSTDMRIQYGQVVRCHKHICVRERNKSRAVQGWVCLKDLTGRLIGISLILSCYLQLGIGQVQLRQPSHERGLARCRGSDVAVVRPNGTTWLIPGKLDFAPGECERIVLVARNGGSAIITRDIVVDTGLARWDCRIAWITSAVSDNFPCCGSIGVDAVGVGLVDHMQVGEVLPDQPSVVRRAGRNVLGQQCPVPGLRDTGSEPYGHGLEAKKLAEDRLLPGLNGFRFDDQGRDLLRVEMAQLAPGPRLAPAGELDVEVDELADRLERIVLCALAWGRLAQHVAQEGGVAGLLRGHVFDQAAVLDSETSIEKVLLAEDFETIVEKVQLDIFLVDAQSHGLVVKIALHHVHGHGAIGSHAAGGHVWHRHWLSQLAIGIVVRGGWVGLNGDSGRQRGRILLSTGGGRGARVGTVGGDASRGTVDQRRSRTGLIPTGRLGLNGGNVDNLCF